MRMGNFSFNVVDNLQYVIVDDNGNLFGHLLKSVSGIPNDTTGTWAWYIDKGGFLLKSKDIQIIQDKLKELNNESNS